MTRGSPPISLLSLLPHTPCTHTRAASGRCGAAAHCRCVGQSLCFCDHRARRVCVPLRPSRVLTCRRPQARFMCSHMAHRCAVWVFVCVHVLRTHAQAVGGGLIDCTTTHPCRCTAFVPPVSLFIQGGWVVVLVSPGPFYSVYSLLWVPSPAQAAANVTRAVFLHRSTSPGSSWLHQS